MTEARPVEELQTITDCVEEVILATRVAVAYASLRTTTARIEEVGYDLYGRVEAILKRAQEIPRQGAPGSPPPTSQPAQPL